MTGYGNRGMTFESLIKYASRRYRAERKAIIEKQNTLCIPLRDRTGKIASAKYEEKATVDFMGKIGKIPVAFEAKHCAVDKIDLKRVEDHQRDFLRDWTMDGESIGFVLVSFELNTVYLIPWDYWQAALDSRERKTKEKVAFAPMKTEWQTTGKASIRKDELPKEWEIRIGGTNGLDYLETVKRLWNIK